MNQCDYCCEIGVNDCKYCYLGNPCLGCLDYDDINGICLSNGGCGKEFEDIDYKEHD